MLSVVLLSLSATFAIDDDGIMAIEDNTEELAIDDVDDDETLALDEDSSIVGDDETPVVTKDTFKNYFDENGELYNNVTAGELKFEGDISDVGVDTIKLNRTIKISGDAVLTNISIDVKAKDVVISGITLNQNKGSAAITVYNASDVVVENTKINFNANAGSDGFAINAELADNLKLLNNAIAYAGATTGWEVNNAIRVSSSNNVAVSGNKIKAKLVSSAVGWAEVPPSSGNWVSSPITEGIVITDSENVTFESNDLNVTYGNIVGEYDTIYSVDFKNTNNAIISNNNIYSTGNTYIYGIILTGDNFVIRGNNITSVGDYYADGIDIEGPAFGVVVDNNIAVYANSSAYGIYSGMNGQNVVANYTNNKISGEAYNIFGMSIGDVETNIVKNTIDLNGNYTTGIAYRGVEASIKENRIVSLSSEVGNESIWDAFGVESVGIKVIKGNVTVFNNTVATSGKGVSFIGNKTNVDMEDNFINVVANADENAFAIYVNDAGVVDILGNTVDYQGTTKGTGINNAVFIFETDGVVIVNNKFDLDLVSSKVAWVEIPEGTDNWVSFPVSEGIVVEDSNNVLFDDNAVNVQFTDVVGTYDTIYAVDFKNSNNSVIVNNEISSIGNTYIYGLLVSGEDFVIRSNTINSTGNYYANGIDIEGPASGVVADNTIAVYSNVSAYGIYSGMNGADVVTNYTNNKISGEAYNIFGMSVGDVETNIVKNNINLDGNYTTGIAYRGVEASIKENHIVLMSSEKGNESIWEGFGVESVGIKVIKGNVTVFNNTVATSGKGVSFTGNQTNVDMEDNFINVVGNPDENAFAIYVNDAGVVDILGNTIDYQGTTKGAGINNAVFIYETDDVVIAKNKFDLDLVSSYVPWFEIPVSSGNWVSFPVSEGIVVEDSNNVLFDDNTVNVQFTDVVGTYDTIYAVDFKNSNNSVIVNNEISAIGNSYIYGLLVSGENFTIGSNTINSTGSYYANGIDIEGPATGIIDKNTIIAKADKTAYPIYAGMNGEPVSTNITENEIIGNAYLVYGIEVAGEEVTIENNNINVEGNYTTGIASKVDQLKVNNNNITSQASNEGNESSGDSMGAGTSGIKVVSGNATISNNNVQTTGDYALDLGKSNANVTDNYLAGKKGVGDNSVVNGNETTVSGSGPNLKTILSAVDLYTTYLSGEIYYVKALDENGDPIKNATLYLTVDGRVINETTDNYGVAAFLTDEWNAGEYAVTVSYKGNETYGPKSINGFISIEKRVSAIAAPASVNVLVTAIKNGYNYKFTLTDDRGNGLANENVTISFNGKTETVSTDGLGVVNYKLVATKVGTQKLTITFDSNKNYVESTATATVKITKEASKLTASKKTFKAKKKSKKYTVTLKDSKGKAISKATLKIKVGKKTYTAKTNAKGKATFNLKKLTKKGKYTAKITFAGNNLYNKATKSVKITVKK